MLQCRLHIFGNSLLKIDVWPVFLGHVGNIYGPKILMCWSEKHKINLNKYHLHFPVFFSIEYTCGCIKYQLFIRYLDITTKAKAHNTVNAHVAQVKPLLRRSGRMQRQGSDAGVSHSLRKIMSHSLHSIVTQVDT